MYSTYLFDLDGTLIDSAELILSSFQYTVRVHLGRASPAGGFLPMMGIPLRDALAALAQTEEQLEAMIETYRRYNLEHHDAEVRAFPGVPTTLEALRARGAALGVVTSKLRQDALRGLRATGLDSLVSLVVGADDVTRGKPHPEPIQVAVRQLSAALLETLVVGDSPHDLQAGRAAGVATAAALWGPFERSALASSAPDHWLLTPADLLGLERPGRAPG